MASISSQSGVVMETFIPCFSIYVNEIAQRAYAENFGTQAAAVAFAEKNLRSFVIRRSAYRVNREIYRGMVVYSKGVA
jgi:hypothetical protein